MKEGHRLSIWSPYLGNPGVESFLFLAAVVHNNFILFFILVYTVLLLNNFFPFRGILCL